MLGIKPHTHAQRTEIVTQLIPLIQKKFGDSFVALAADGSYARGEDTDYSDLEVIVFLKEIPDNVDWSEHKIIDGLLVVIVPETKDSIIKKYLDVTEYWYASGAGKLLPIINKEFVDEVNSFAPEDVAEKCRRQIQKRWPEYQEITAKVLNNINQKDKEAFAITFPTMIKELLVILSYLNATPFITLGKYIAQAKQFNLKPMGFDELIAIQVSGDYQDLENIGKMISKVFADLEAIALSKGVQLYADELV
jgi:predicted ATP-dependent Lon-type protease